MKKLEIHRNKILKLSNAVSYMLENDDFLNLDKTVYQMENYIKSKGAMPIGPLVQCTEVQNDAGGEPKIQVSLIRQANTFINKMETPYTIQSVLRVPNCLYIRFVEDESHINFAQFIIPYQKSNAFFETNLRKTLDTTFETATAGQDGQGAEGAEAETKNVGIEEPILDAHILLLQKRIQELEQQVDEIIIEKINSNHYSGH